MIEVVFDDSAAGSLKIAMGGYRPTGKVIADPIVQEGGSEPTQADMEQFRKKVEKEQRNWADTVELNGCREDIMVFPLALSVGDIDEDGIGDKRKGALKSVTVSDLRFPEDIAKEQWEKGQHSLDSLLVRTAKGEPIRIWASNNPDEMCGLYWLMEQLRPIGFENLDVTLVKLPDFEERPDGVVVQYIGWGEMEPDRWGKMAMLGKKLPANYIRGLANQWKHLQRENTPLRAVVNGQLVSVPENLYDSFILREINAQKEDFMEANIIGSLLGKYQLGIGDGWISMRMEHFIQEGLLEVVSPADENRLGYCRVLRKCSGMRK